MRLHDHAWMLTAALTISATSLAGDTFTEGFEDGTNEAGWSWGTGGEEIVPVGGNPDAFLQDLTLATFTPIAATGCQIDIEDDGTVRIYAPNADSLSVARLEVESITAEAEVGAIYTGVVARVVDFGAFVNILPGKDGLVHISQIANERIERVADHLSEGQEVKVKVLDVDSRGRIKLSMKEIAEHELQDG